MENYIIEEIPEEIVKKYCIGKNYELGVLKYSSCMKTPFSGYEIFEVDSKYYVKIPHPGA